MDDTLGGGIGSTRLFSPGVRRTVHKLAGVGVAYDRKAVDSRAPRSIFWLLAFWVILVLAALVWGVDNAEATLQDSARRTLAAEGHDIVVDFSGRDARLIGTVATESVATDIAGNVDRAAGFGGIDDIVGGDVVDANGRVR